MNLVLALIRIRNVPRSVVMPVFSMLGWRLILNVKGHPVLDDTTCGVRD